MRGETPKSWLSDEIERPEATCLPEILEEDSSDKSDAEDVEPDRPVVNDSGSEPTEPAELTSEVSQRQNEQQAVVRDEVVKDVPATDERALRDRGRLRRPARFVD